jgi:hypothetical protein
VLWRFGGVVEVRLGSRSPSGRGHPWVEITLGADAGLDADVQRPSAPEGPGVEVTLGVEINPWVEVTLGAERGSMRTYNAPAPLRFESGAS